MYDDDLFLLRFVLSHKGNVHKAAKAVRRTIEYRAEHQEFIRMARERTQPIGAEKVAHWATNSKHKSTREGEPIEVIVTEVEALVTSSLHTDISHWSDSPNWHLHLPNGSSNVKRAA